MFDLPITGRRNTNAEGIERKGSGSVVKEEAGEGQSSEDAAGISSKLARGRLRGTTFVFVFGSREIKVDPESPGVVSLLNEY